MTEESIVRENLMTKEGYTPYCGNNDSSCYNPRTVYRPVDGQFICPHCKWISKFPKDFIDRYKQRWNLK